MKNTLMRNLLRSVAFLALLVLILQGTGRLLQPRDNTLDAGIELQRVHGYLGEPDNSIDVIFLGDSVAYCGYSPMEMWEQQGFTAYVCAISAESLDDTYAFLLETTAHQHPKLVVVEALPAFREMPMDDNLYTEAAIHLPVFSIHNSWKAMTLERLLSPVEYTYRNVYRGYQSDKTSFPQEIGNYMKPSGEPVEIDLCHRIYLDRIVRYCKANDLPMMFLSCPSPLNWNWGKHEAVQAYADSVDVPFLDLNLALEDIGLDGQPDLQDEGGDHLNHSGAVKTSVYLASYLAQTYNLPDHREDPDYENWNQALNKYRNKYPPVTIS